MSCERYEKAIIEAAASSIVAASDALALPDAVREHLDSCEDCRALLAEEQALFAAIDGTLRQQANAELGPHFLPRVQAALTQQVAAKREGIPAWAYGLAAASLMLSMILAQGWLRPGNGPSQQNVANVAPAPHPESSLEPPPSFKPSQTIPAKAHTGESLRTPSRTPEVLVPPGQEELLARFYEATRSKPNGASAARGQQSDATPAPLVIAPIEIAQLEIQNLEQRGDVSR